MNAAPSKTAPLLMRIAEAIAKCRPAIKVEVLEGYQDESGFHYGVKPVEQQVAWPPTE